MPTAATFFLRPIEPADATFAQGLWSARFGGNPSTQKNWIEAALNPSHTAAGFVAVSSSGDQIVGMSFLDVGRRRYTREYLGLEALDLDVPLAERNGIFHLSCVQTDWEGHGIGSAFYGRRLEVLADRGVNRAFGIAWHRPAPVDSRVLFEKWGFEVLATVERYYERTTPRKHCPACGGPCSCTASLYARYDTSV